MALRMAMSACQSVGLSPTLVQTEISMDCHKYVRTFKMLTGWILLTFFHEVDIFGFEWNVLTSIGWISMEFSAHIHVSLRINRNNSGEYVAMQALPFTSNHHCGKLLQNINWMSMTVFDDTGESSLSRNAPRFGLHSTTGSLNSTIRTRFHQQHSNRKVAFFLHCDGFRCWAITINRITIKECIWLGQNLKGESFNLNLGKVEGECMNVSQK